MKNSLIIITILILQSCSMNQKLVKQGTPLPLKENEGYLGLTINAVESLSAITIKNTETGSKHLIGPISYGIHQYTLLLTAGEYCISRVDAHGYHFDYNNGGFCVYLEEGEMNYLGELAVRTPLSYLNQRFTRYRKLMNRDYPELCNKYIGKGCE
ncbi:MAG: hypothetical protein COA86_06350 [Kangiella sp.]|nr:MAG: hypothetical protein COA86_06350 [Kangiella sp.]